MSWLRLRPLLAVLALCGVTALAYSNSFQAGFALDNKTLLLNDARIRAANTQNLTLIFQRTYCGPMARAVCTVLSARCLISSTTRFLETVTGPRVITGST